MAKASRAPNPALLGGDEMSADESGQMDANRESEGSAPEAEPDAPAPESPAPEPAPEAGEHEDKIDPATGKERVVNYGALHAERQKRKAAEGETAKAREETAKIMGRFETIQQLVQRAQQPQQAPQPQAPTEEIPDINLDPVGHFQAQLALANKRIETFDKWQQTQEANATAMNNVAQLQRIAQTHEADFKKTAPDYDDAFQYVRKMRDQELEYMGYTDPGVRQQIIQNDALQIAAQALQGNRNAAEVVYNIAKARGWAGKAPALTPQPVAPAQSPDVTKLKTIAKGQAASQSLGQVNGSAPAAMSVESLLKMSDADFEKATEGDNWRKIMGG